MNLNPIVASINDLSQREGVYLPILKGILFEELKNKYETKPLKNILTKYSSGAWGKTHLTNGVKAKVLRSPDIRFGRIDFENAKERYFDKKDIKSLRLCDDDILVIKSNGSIDLVGKSQIYHSNITFKNVCASNFIMILRPNEELVYPLYLDLFLKSPQSLSWRYESQKTTTGLRNLKTKEYLSAEVPLPEIKIQKQIVKDFDKYAIGDYESTEGIIDKKSIQRLHALADNFNNHKVEVSHQQSLLKKLRQAILQEAVQGKLVPQDPNDEPASELLKRIKAEKEKRIVEGKIRKEKPLPPIKEEEIPFELPKGWVWCRLGEICDVIGGFAFESTKYIKESINQVIRLGNVKNDRLLLDAHPVFIDDNYAIEASNAKLCKGDILITMTGTRSKRDYMFTLLLCKDDYKERNLFLNQRVGCFRFSNHLVVEYFNTLLKDRRLLEPVFLSSTGAVNQANIGMAALKEIIIPLPPASEQLQIFKKMKYLFTNCNLLEKQIEENAKHSELLLQAVLKEAFEPKTVYKTLEPVYRMVAEKK